MTGRIDARLADLGIVLPTPPKPAASYVPTVRTGNLLWVSGQIPLGPDGPVVGKLGRDTDVAAGAAAARLCALALLAQVKAATGDLDKVKRVVKLTGFVNSAPGFGDQPKVVNGCSDFLVELFGERGRHARSAVGAALPFGVAVEVEGIFEVA